MDSYQKFISEKAKRKRELIGKMFFPRKPVLLLDFSENPKLKDFEDLLEGLDEIGLTTLVIGAASEKNFESAKHIHYLAKDKKSIAKEAADFIVILDSRDIGTAFSSGCVPISHQNGDSTVNYSPLQEKGNGFYFKNLTKWELFATIVRALETYQFPYDWENLIREILGRQN